MNGCFGPGAVTLNLFVPVASGIRDGPAGQAGHLRGYAAAGDPDRSAEPFTGRRCRVRHTRNVVADPVTAWYSRKTLRHSPAPDCAAILVHFASRSPRLDVRSGISTLRPFASLRGIWP